MSAPPPKPGPKKEDKKPLPRLFVVDDDNHLLRRLAALLEDDYNIRTFDTPMDLLSSLETTTPDGILSDVVMPEMNGFELTKKIREKLADIPIALWSAYSRPEDAEKGEASGANAFMRKPVTVGELARVLDRILSLEGQKGIFIDVEA